jgi:hypothetical protein
MWQASNRENEEKRIWPEDTISADLGGDEYTCLRSLDERGWMWSVDGVNARARTVSPRADFNNVVLTIFVIAAGA